MKHDFELQKKWGINTPKRFVNVVVALSLFSIAYSGESHAAGLVIADETATASAPQLATPLGKYMVINSARGDGVTDDSAAIQAAIDAAPSGEVLFLPAPANFYKISATIRITKPLTLLGADSLIKNPSDPCPTFIRVLANDVQIRRLHLAGPQQTCGYAITVGSDGAPFRNITIEDNKIENFYNGITLIEVNGFRLAGNSLSNMNYYGIEGAAVKSGVIDRNTVRSVSGNNSSGNAYGIVLSRSAQSPANPRSTDVVVSNNIVQDVPVWECYDTHGGQRIRFIDNFCKNAKLGINVAFSGKGQDDADALAPLDCEISGNTVEKNAAEPYRDAIVFAGTYTQSATGSIKGNTLIGFGSTGIYTVNANVTQTSNQNFAHRKSDLIFRNAISGQISAWLMNGTTATATAGLIPPGNWTVTHVADFNGDGRADILYLNDDGSVTLWLMNGLSVISSIGLLGPNPDWTVSHVADFNGDGKADILWRNINGAVSLWLMDGITVIGTAGLIGPNPDWSVSHVGDFNGDGKSDILWRNANGAATMWLMNGISIVSTAGLLGPDPNWRISHVADFDGDGKSDLLWRNTNGAVTAWLMNGSTIISTAGLLGPDPNWSVSHVGDFNGDGKADLLWRNTNGAVTMWLMNGTTVLGTAGVLGADANWRVSHLADYNGDGKADLVWRNTTDGSITMWLMNGATTLSATGILGTSPWSVVPPMP